MRCRIMPSLVLAALLALPGCGDLPQPFLGRPGAMASRLSQPPPSRLSIPAPTESLLPDAGANAWAGAIAEALVAEEIPAAASPNGRRGDWSLLLSAEVHGRDVVPTYTVRNPAGVAQGFSEGAPVPAADWASGNPTVLKAAAVQAAPGVASLLQKIEAARQLSDPNSLMNRPSRVYFAGVTGAPGDGNTSLAQQMQTRLTGLGLVVQDTPRGADFALRGEVKTALGAKGAIRIELQWVVANGDEAAAERGRVVQLNEVPPGSLDHYWGDVAVVVATEAASGVRDVILNSGGGRAPARSTSPSGRGPG